MNSEQKLALAALFAALRNAEEAELFDVMRNSGVDSEVINQFCDLIEGLALSSPSPKERWFINHYHCDECNESWDDEWSCMCDDECPSCGEAYTPVSSEEIEDEPSPKERATLMRPLDPPVDIADTFDERGAKHTG